MDPGFGTAREPDFGEKTVDSLAKHAGYGGSRPCESPCGMLEIGKEFRAHRLLTEKDGFKALHGEGQIGMDLPYGRLHNLVRQGNRRQ